MLSEADRGNGPVLRPGPDRPAELAHSPGPPRPNRRWLSVSLFLGTVLLGLGLATFGQPLRLATTREPQTFTELYFTGSTQKITTGEGRTTMSFTIRNAQGRPTAYSYVVRVNGRARQEGTTPIVAESGLYHVRVSGLALPKPPDRARVEVELGSGQAIRAWMSR